MKKNLLCHVYLILLFLLPVSLTELFGQNDFHFAVLSDRTGGAYQPAFERVIQDIISLHPDFIVTVGDLVEDGMESDYIAQFSLLENLPCPIYYTAGNNDIIDDYTENLFRQFTGHEPYFSFDYQNSCFIIMDNSRWDSFEELPEEQKVWLRSELETNQNKQPLFLIMHRPFWTTALEEEGAAEITNLCETYGVDVVFSGHWHRYIHEVINQTQYLLLGSSGARLSGPENDDLARFYQFLWCHVRGDEIDISLIKSGFFYPVDLFNWEEYRMVQKIERTLIRCKSEMIDNDLNNQLIEIEVENPTDKNFSSSLQITPRGWAVSNPDIPFLVDPQDIFKTTLTVEGSPDLAEIPLLSCSYPFGRDKLFPYEKPLPLLQWILCAPRTEIPVIDGAIDPLEWSSSYVFSDFHDTDGTSSRTESTRFYSLYDEEYIYIAWLCEESHPEFLPADTGIRDDPIYYHDCIGMLLHGSGDIYYQIYVNSSGNITDIRNNLEIGAYETDWNCNITQATKVQEKSWSLEMRIPRSEILFTDRDITGINLQRYQESRENYALFIPEWSFTSVNLGSLKLE